MKKRLFILLIFILIIGNVDAFDKEKSVEWVKNNINENDPNTESISFGLLTLKSNNLMSQDSALYLSFQRRRGNEGCFNMGSCNVKDTSLGTLVSSSFGSDYSDLSSWIDSSLGKADVEDWYLEVTTLSSGKCTITYDDEQKKVIEINGNGPLKIEGQSGEFNFIPLKSIGVNLDKPIEEIIVDCAKPAEFALEDSAPLISLLRIVDNNVFYHYETKTGKEVRLTINNACYYNSQGQCSKEDSFYAAWVLNKLGRSKDDIKIIPYLEKTASTNKDYAMLLSITNDQKYEKFLIDNQDTSGYWDNQDILTTSFAINALKSRSNVNELNKAINWVKSKQISSQDNNGSYGSVLNTAGVLYLVFDTSSYIPPSKCGNGVLDLGEECDGTEGCSSTCNLENENSCSIDSDCEIGEFCEEGKCKKMCKFNSECLNSQKPNCNIATGKCEFASSCNRDGICNSEYGETELNCSADCKVSGCTKDNDCSYGEKCKDGECKADEQTDTGCNDDSECSEDQICNLETNECEEKTGLGVLFWASLIIILGILGVGGYFGYHKFIKKERIPQNQFIPKQPIQVRQSYPINKPKPIFKKSKVDSNLERELDKSIRETQNLLKK